MKIKYKGFISPKQSEKYADCADAYSANTKDKVFSCAISDGVTQSFLPQHWSKILVKQYVSDALECKDLDISKAQGEWSKVLQGFIQAQLKNEAVNEVLIDSINKGYACATLAGLKIYQNDGRWMWNASALGDTFIIFIPDNSDGKQEIVSSLTPSKDRKYEFDNYPNYYISRESINDNGTNKRIESQYGEVTNKGNLELENGDFYLLTDAMAEWFLKSCKDNSEILQNIKCQEDFIKKVEELRKSGALKDDDSTVIHIEITEVDKTNEFVADGELQDLEKLINDERQNVSEPLKDYIGLVMAREDKKELLTKLAQLIFTFDGEVRTVNAVSIMVDYNNQSLVPVKVYIAANQSVISGKSLIDYFGINCVYLSILLLACNPESQIPSYDHDLLIFCGYWSGDSDIENLNKTIKSLSNDNDEVSSLWEKIKPALEMNLTFSFPPATT